MLGSRGNVALSVLALILLEPMATAAVQAAQPKMPATLRTIRLPPAQSGDPPPVVTAVHLHPNGRWLATAGDDHLIRIVELPSGKTLRTMRGHRDWVGTVAFSPDGQYLVTAGHDERVVMWRVADGKARWSTGGNGKTPLGPPARIQFNHAGDRLAVVGFDRPLQLIDAQTGRIRADLDCPCRDMRCVAFSADDRLLAAAGRNGRVRIWQTSNGAELRTVPAHRQRVRDLIFSRSGHQLITASEDREVRVWNLETGEHQFSLTGAPGKVLSLVMLPDDRLATACSDNVIRIWDLKSQRLVSQLRGHHGSVADLDANDRWLVSAGFDATVRVWSLAAMNEAIVTLERQRTRAVTEQRALNP